jgi:hypothetical protein
MRWLETRSESERAVYPHIVALARGVIGEAFSARVITPGVTTTADVAWYIRERFVQIKLEQSALFDGEQVKYLAGRQTQWHVVQ